MPVMSSDLHEIMTSASAALAHMDYLSSEVLCVQALQLAKQQACWADYARIILPLQECRRQRRMMAAEGDIRLGSASLSDSPADWLTQIGVGCMVLTQPHSRDEAHQLQALAQKQKRCIEVLWADCSVDEPTWRLRSFVGAKTSVETPAPPADWRDRQLNAESAGLSAKSGEIAGSVKTAAVAADWFLDACEMLGDAALAQVAAAPGQLARIEQLEHAIEAVVDHEILHQQLWRAARSMRTRS